MKRGKSIASSQDHHEWPRRTIERAARNLYGQTCCNVVFAMALGGMFLTALLKTLGASHFQIGLAGFCAVTVGCFQIFSSSLVERWFNRKKIINITYIFRVILMWSVALAMFTGLLEAHWLIWVILISVSLSQTMFYLANPIWFSWVCDLLPTRTKGSFFGMQLAINQALSTLLLISIGFLINRQSGGDLSIFIFIWFLAGASEFVAIFLNRKLPEPPVKPSLRGNRFFKNLLEIIHLKDYRLLLFICVSLNFFYQATWTFSVVYFKDVLEIGWLYISFITATWTLSLALSSPVWGFIVDRVGSPRVVLVFSIALIAIESLLHLLILPQSVSIMGFSFMEYHLVFPISALSGFAYGGYAVSMAHLQSTLTPQENRTMLVGAFNALSAIFTGISPLIVGLLLEWPSFANLRIQWIPSHEIHYIHVLYIVLAISCFALIPICLWIRKEHENTRQVISTVLGGGLINNLFSVWRFKHLATEEQVAEHIKTKIHPGSKILLPELIGRLNDPSLSVRAESISKLGLIRSESTVSHLIEKLEDPSYHLELDIIWALGEIRSTKAIPVLKRFLHHSNEEIVSRSARSLGKIGDPEVQDAMLRVLEREKRSKPYLAICEALVELHSTEVMPYLIDEYVSSQSTLHRTQIALNIACLYGMREELYGAIRLEEVDSGSSFERLAQDKRFSLLFLACQFHKLNHHAILDRLHPFLGEAKLTAFEKIYDKKDVDSLDALLLIFLLKGQLPHINRTESNLIA